MPEDDYEARRAERLGLSISPSSVDREKIDMLVRSKPALPDPALFGVSTEAPASVMVEVKPLTVQDIMHERTEVQS